MISDSSSSQVEFFELSDPMTSSMLGHHTKEVLVESIAYVRKIDRMNIVLSCDNRKANKDTCIEHESKYTYHLISINPWKSALYVAIAFGSSKEERVAGLCNFDPLGYI